MNRVDIKAEAMSKLISARKEIEDVLRLAVPLARYDPVVLRSADRTKLAEVWDELGRILGQLQEEQ